MTTAYVTHADCLLNDIGPGHPECPDRLASVNESMRTSGLVTELRCLEAPSAEPLDLKRVHHGAYVDLIFENAPAEGRADAVRHNVWPLLASGRVRPIIHATFPLTEAPAAHQLMESSSHIGKIVLTVP